MGAQQLWFGIILTAGMAGTGLVSAWRQVLVLRNDRETMPAAAFRRWMESHDMTLDTAAAALGLFGL